MIAEADVSLLAQERVLLGFRIFLASVYGVVQRCYAALRMSALLYLSILALVGLLFVVLPDRRVSFTPEDPSPLLAFPLMMAIACLASLIAVRWHRYILQTEAPIGLLPLWDFRVAVGYFWRCILVFIPPILAMLALLGVTVSIPFDLLVQARWIEPASDILFRYLFYRFAVLLPAYAVGRKLTMMESWRSTGDIWLAILVLAASTQAFSTLLVYSLEWLGAPQPVFVYWIIGGVWGWCVMMIGVNQLTLVYSHLFPQTPKPTSR